MVYHWASSRCDVSLNRRNKLNPLQLQFYSHPLKLMRFQTQSSLESLPGLGEHNPRKVEVCHREEGRIPARTRRLVRDLCNSDAGTGVGSWSVHSRRCLGFFQRSSARVSALGATGSGTSCGSATGRESVSSVGSERKSTRAVKKAS